MSRIARRTSVQVLAAALVAACGLDSGGQINPEVDRIAITTQIDAAIEATRNKDIDGYMAQIPEDIQMYDADGNPMTLLRIRDQVLASWANIERTRNIEAIVDSLTVSGDSAVVYTSQTWDRLVTRPDSTVPTGQAVDTIITFSQKREMWRRTPAGWRAFHVVDLGGTTSINGSVLVRPPGRAGEPGNRGAG
jgi:hypothetical protein